MPEVHLNLWPHGHSTAVLVRDDDISYFTPPYKLDRVYGRLWKQGFKISLSIIPNVKATEDPLVPPSYRGKLSLHKLHENHDLVDYLNDKLKTNQVDVAQHGYTHELVFGMPEFSIGERNQIKARLKSGRLLLEKCLHSEISVFVPPHNMISRQAKEVLRQEGLAFYKGKETVRTRLRLLCNIFQRHEGMTQKISAACFRLLDNKRRASNVMASRDKFAWSNHSLTFDDTAQRVYNVEDDDFSAIFPFRVVTANGGLFSISNHYHHYYKDWKDEVDQKMVSALYRMLDFVESQGVWKTSLTEVVDWMKQLKTIEVRSINSGKRMVLKTPKNVTGVTLKAVDCSLVPLNDEDNVRIKEKDNTTLLIFDQLKAGESEVAIENH
jgi:predicted deacetylase